MEVMDNLITSLLADETQYWFHQAYLNVLKYMPALNKSVSLITDCSITYPNMISDFIWKMETTY